jgi:hypothetical protein
MLADAKASAVLLEYGDGGEVCAISFRIKTEFGVMSFRMPANVDAVLIALQRDKALPYRLRNKKQAARVAWRIIKDWLEAQLALIRVGVTLDQMFLPFAQDSAGVTLYERMRDQRFRMLTLTEPPGA